MRRHVLKTWPEPFWQIVLGNKTCEVRSTKDRTFGRGDRLQLDEFDPENGQRTGRQIFVEVTHIVEGGQFGVPDDLCVMSIEKLPRQQWL